ncbi:Transposase [Micromonospora viridifaciens]|uniref:Transposase n=1 Tax=Micromonospora viridifaciens TaxID=1881 RepID=A0A1C4ZSP6_MICVI|nr:IS110 family transposase [Micromonospora viridifaciens]SCE74401.1 Transposase [Micromonospora viridifaciens]SCE75829.1 Transposase [Micromonospora viridifaciens]SCE85966.1 Transposase [Micromonospora viridifaciens]SCE88321.1 Transposase [Micromonospora viridifaciens]SCF23815.1 Transposase [Micromonospora viridifaciens]
MLEQTQDREEIISRVAALDIGKASLVCCVRVPDEARPGRRLQEVQTYSTMTRSLAGMAERLRGLGVTRVVMEATSDYWKPAFYLLEAYGFEVWLVNARDVKHLPGRPKTDKLDAVWLCKVAERQMIRPSFVPPPPIRMLRDLTRYRVDLVAQAGAERNRVEKLLEDAQIKLSVVVSDLFGVSGRAMMAALIAGRRDPKSLAQMARSSLRRKIPALEEALTGHFNDHHAFLLGKMIARVEAIEADIAEVDARIEAQLAPFVEAAARLIEIPGVGPAAAAAIIAEIGVDMSRFPTPAHLAGWARFAPGVKESAGRKKGSGSTGHGNPYLARVLGQIAVSAARTNTFLGERYRRIARRRGAKRAIVAVGRSVLTIIWHLLADPEAHFQDLGADFYLSRTDTERRKRNHISQLEALGYRVTLELAA